MRRLRVAFTLVELLVVIAIIGILVALLLPAIQSAREAARRNQCLNNLKQMALAAQNYVDSYKAFPPGKLVSSNADYTGWTIELLPFMEEAALYKRYQPNKPNTHADNGAVTSTILNVMTCPSDENAGKLATPEADPAGRQWATGSYRAVTGKGYTNLGSFEAYFDSKKLAITTNFPLAYRGILTVLPFDDTATAEVKKLRQARMRNVTDGTSKTMLVGEYSAYTRIERTVFWAKTWFAMNMGSIVMDGGPDILNPDYEQCLKTVPGTGRADVACKRTITSLHGAGGLVQFCFADGSTRAIPIESDIKILGALSTMAGQENVEVPK